ncbi:phosphoglycolate phosphatase [Enterobacillus tribolii]|uniref:Phosphoglycolate phosphatase n=1 Tax=Enterobacillus tribolii TaxID=1487935 RepID=A0A370QTR5_9GAMM|nr:phosphoglycolate phosphatase [Enterobacillus tribolii]MBW7981288.1 phosphoglycolate phosphatase [Enterobacillus tribolii]RDK92650.1 phosphoglycolate phosphatase [Enterobacillus tribolii]
MSNPDGIRAIAFDLDGTLVDSAPGLAAAMDKAMKEQGFPEPGEERVKLWIGNGADMLVKRALAWANVEPAESLCQRVRAGFDFYYANSAETGSRLYPQVRETLTALYHGGFPLALVTNKPTPFVRPMLSALDIDVFFAEVIGGDDVTMRKPHPAPLYLVMAKLGLYAQELLFVGDSRNDIQAARSAGCRSVGMTYGYNYGEPIAHSEPDRVLPGFSDLLPLLGLPPLNHQEL